MNKTWLILLVVGVVLIGLFLLAAVASFVFLPQLGDLMTQPKGPVLVYEVDPTSLTPGQQVDMDKLVRAVSSRLKAGWKSLARVRKLDGQRIEVAVVGQSASDKERVEKLLTSVGALQFRILANTRDNKDLIEKALANPLKAKLLGKDGTLAAWWVPLKAGQENAFAGYREIALRTKTNAGRKTTEVLVLNDIYNVTGAYLSAAHPSIDSQKKPCITFALNEYGGKLFGLMTESHLPDELTGFSYKIAIILDDEVYSAPAIRSIIREYGEITGSFTMDEVNGIAGVLNVGTLPAKIRPVKVRQNECGNSHYDATRPHPQQLSRLHPENQEGVGDW
jgi:preprotein translocase subunit SecD